MYFYDEILHVDLEMSSLCNAKCPICNRRQQGGPKNTSYKETYLSLDRFKTWFDDKFISQNAEIYYKSSVSLPIYYGLKFKEQQKVIENINKFI